MKIEEIEATMEAHGYGIEDLLWGLIEYPCTEPIETPDGECIWRDATDFFVLREEHSFEDADAFIYNIKDFNSYALPGSTLMFKDGAWLTVNEKWKLEFNSPGTLYIPYRCRNKKISQTSKL